MKFALRVENGKSVIVLSNGPGFEPLTKTFKSHSDAVDWRRGVIVRKDTKCPELAPVGSTPTADAPKKKRGRPKKERPVVTKK